MRKDKKVHIQTFGCQMNVSDSERMLQLLSGIGYHHVDNWKEADLLILNTCSVRSKAEEKIYSILSTIKGKLKRNSGLIIGVGGCVAQQEGEKLLKMAPHLNFVCGTHNIHLLPQMVKEAEAGKRVSDTAFIDNEMRFDLFPKEYQATGVSHLVTIMQGCDNYCSYCIVPYVRGREASRQAEDILAEIKSVASKGVREVILLGQNVNSYNLGAGSANFPALLTKVAEIDNIERIRFVTSHPKDISSELVNSFSTVKKLCSHIHLPVQAGSNRVLAMMNRGYSREEYLLKIEQLKKARPGISVTSDIIVGFPGETEEDFKETLALVEEVGYSDSYCFVYSPRPETKAAEMPDPVPKDEKQERLERLLELQRGLSKTHNMSLEGSVQKVLVEGSGGKTGQISGRTSGNRIVNFPGSAELVGNFVDVKIIRGYQNSLLGELVS
ncbi:MAG: tRNA (N6-isopentenyl adenosine(37)-C2)-methylthiotransferase MiaB [Desulfuromonadales bacterium]|nr:tRNA (N6-isopentenyl adenosine(37)-C2)-methylthiotransferase MiaB [Desulfuromonadales bacterium]